MDLSTKPAVSVHRGYQGQRGFICIAGGSRRLHDFVQFSDYMITQLDLISELGSKRDMQLRS